jgi:tripartite motif-containing protein 71
MTVLKNNFTENFNKPITLTFTFDPASLKGNQKAVVFPYDEAKKEWVEVGIKLTGNKINVEVDHFTKFAVIAVDAMQDIPVKDDSTNTTNRNQPKRHLRSLGRVRHQASSEHRLH